MLAGVGFMQAFGYSSFKLKGCEDKVTTLVCKNTRHDSSPALLYCRLGPARTGSAVGKHEHC